MIVITLSKVPESLRGDLTRWCQEIQTGVYVGNVNTRIRELLWERIRKNIGQGNATLVYNTNNELGYAIETTKHDYRVIDSDGIPLMEKIFFLDNNLNRKHFSDAYKFHQVKKRNQMNRKKQNNFSNYVVIDIETTGLNFSKDKIISIGAIKFENNEVTNFYYLVDDKEIEISEKIEKMTGISKQKLLERGLALDKILEKLKIFIGNNPLIGYNLPFDDMFIRKALNKYGLRDWNNKRIDLLHIIKHNEKFLDNYKLITVLKHYGIDNGQSHNALQDAKATFQLTNKLIEKGDLQIYDN